MTSSNGATIGQMDATTAAAAAMAAAATVGYWPTSTSEMIGGTSEGTAAMALDCWTGMNSQLFGAGANGKTLKPLVTFLFCHHFIGNALKN